jgi:hypothetical protein
VLFSLAIGYDTWQGRFFMYPVALSAALWGLAVRVPPVAWAAVAIGATTVALSLVNSLEKPSGVRLFADRSTPSVWRMSRWQVQSLSRPGWASALRMLEESVPPDASVALAIGEDDFGYPVFGPQLRRRIELAPRRLRDAPLTRARWLLTSPSRATEVDLGCWHLVLRSDAANLYSRRNRGCPTR